MLPFTADGLGCLRCGDHVNRAGFDTICFGSLVESKPAFPTAPIAIREGAIVPEDDELPIFDGLLVGRAVLLLAGRKHGAAAATVAAAVVVLVAAAAAIIPCGEANSSYKKIKNGIAKIFFKKNRRKPLRSPLPYTFSGSREWIGW